MLKTVTVASWVLFMASYILFRFAVFSIDDAERIIMRTKQKWPKRVAITFAIQFILLILSIVLTLVLVLKGGN